MTKGIENLNLGASREKLREAQEGDQTTERRPLSAWSCANKIIFKRSLKANPVFDELEGPQSEQSQEA